MNYYTTMVGSIFFNIMIIVYEWLKYRSLSYVFLVSLSPMIHNSVTMATSLLSRSVNSLLFSVRISVLILVSHNIIGTSLV